MEENERQIELGDLPDYCVVEILKKVKTRVDRNEARLVCKLWHRLIDADSSCERYLIDPRTACYVGFCLPFRNYIPQFLKFNRNKISFRFMQVDLHNTEHFWSERGARIVGLNFEEWCFQIPLEYIFSRCIRLREMSIEYPVGEIIDALKSLAVRESYNYSLNYLTITGKPGNTKVEVATQLVALVGKVFPRMRKVQLHKFVEINGCNYEELATKFGPLKCELELNSNHCTIVFNLSSKTPISIRKVLTTTCTLSPPEYYEDLEHITFSNEDSTFQLSRLEKIFPQCSALQSLSIVGGTLMNDLSGKLATGNRLKHLRLLGLGLGDGHVQFATSEVFFDMFPFIKTFHLFNASRTTFRDILLNAHHLEELQIEILPWFVNEYPEINEVREVLVHDNLKELTIPLILLHRTGTIYRFDNLTKITVQQNETRFGKHDVDETLQCFQCPNLELLLLEEILKISRLVDSLWLKNVMSMFPKLKQYDIYLSASDDHIREDKLWCELRIRVRRLNRRWRFSKPPSYQHMPTLPAFAVRLVWL